MILRIVTYPLLAGRGFGAWIREHGDELRSAPGVERVEFLQSLDDPRYVGAILRFADIEGLEAYLGSDFFLGVKGDLKANWVDSSLDGRQGHYEVVED